MISAPLMPRTGLRARFLYCLVVVAAAFGALALRLAWLQVVQGPRYGYLSENNRIRLQRYAAPRGVIFDRNGEILADVQATFDATAIPGEIPKAQRPAVYDDLARILSLAPDAVKSVLEGPGPPSWKARVLARQIDRAQMAQLEAHRLELPGVVVQPNPARRYPFGALLGAALGYVGEVSGKEISQPAYAEYEVGDFLGRGGLEWAWEAKLRGEAGGEQVEVDVQGRRLSVLAERPAKPGQSLILSIDRRVQQAAEEALGNQVGSVVVLDVLSGDVLALASRPTFDPNFFARGITPDEWAALANDPHHPLQNRAVQGLYPPASTFKISMALAGLAEGLITPRSRATCSGELTFGGRSYRCWNTGGHGSVDLDGAIAQSCDVYFYQLGLDLGIERISSYAKLFGLGKPSGIDLPGDRTGIVPSKEWKRTARKQPWYQGETVSTSIGQGYLLVTPVQLASMIASVAHPRGVRMAPRLVTRVEDAEGHPLEVIPPREAGRLPFRQAHLDVVRQGLRRVVAGAGGTGHAAEVSGFPVAGKTGTAQVIGMKGEEGSQAGIAWEKRDHALFVAYAPADDPKIAVAVVMEHGGHGGSAAAPVARAVIQAYKTATTGGEVAVRKAPPEAEEPVP
ncbi:MAG: penicillin-binding protein 2 [Deltaproteobacteria bacterium]|nr:penicillin-binding protein 2 [Deltaproteobacteria bacterium]